MGNIQVAALVGFCFDLETSDGSVLVCLGEPFLSRYPDSL